MRAVAVLGLVVIAVLCALDRSIDHFVHRPAQPLPVALEVGARSQPSPSLPAPSRSNGSHDDVASPPSGGFRAWSPDSPQLPLPRAGEVAQVPAHRLATYDPTQPGPAPNPFVPQPQRLSAEDSRVGLDLGGAQ